MRWNTLWTIVRDVALTGTGVVVIILQALSVHRDHVLLTIGWLLTTPSGIAHAGILLGRGAGLSSPSPSPPPPSPSGLPQEVGSEP